MMNKEELRAYARHGIRVRLAEIERELRDLQKEFPEEFYTTTPIVLLSAEKKSTGNDWPAFKAVEANSNGHKASWTPERRAAQAERMRKQHKGKGGRRDGTKDGSMPSRVLFLLRSKPLTNGELVKAMGLKTQGEKGAMRKALSDLKQRKLIIHDHHHKWKPRAAAVRPGPLGTASGIKMDFWEYLRAHGPSRGIDVAKALKLKNAANVIGSSTEWIRADIIRRLGKGMYEAGPVEPPPPPTVHHET